MTTAPVASLPRPAEPCYVTTAELLRRTFISDRTLRRLKDQMIENVHFLRIPPSRKHYRWNVELVQVLLHYGKESPQHDAALKRFLNSLPFVDAS
ncbi:MAG: hypothetical protein IGQ88_06755 [Gloeomargaritaceae cyanobacterium C42_A2020_066]|nr:hypothetical protein [Gloeomargaritaceae cyanobacterium C42_A2020_066]